ncbi:Rrf2 family protein [Rhizobium skierniewicense]|uniref:Rrf2 family protein n=1 Tax=Rhizobium skierniewicense TaxID=984260 RepID=A0A7W6CDH8_9HYPH|nr:Rrf2 family transcriptional regulator [Rhizobium skierniewicense]MBB3948403.1 Rrf2 family protein [Rhizobium skierniewicense]
MRLLTSTDVGVNALIYMAAVLPREVVQQSEIQECFGIVQSALKRPFRLLGDAEIITTRMGRSGGHSWLRDPATVSLREVIELLEADFEIAPILAIDEQHKPRHPKATLSFVYERSRTAFLKELERFNFAEIAGDPYTLEALGIEIPKVK